MAKTSPPPPRIHDPAGLAEALAAMGLGPRDHIENQANQHSYVYGNNETPLGFCNDWPMASQKSQGVRGGWVRAIYRRRLGPWVRPTASSPSAGPAPSSTPTPFFSAGSTAWPSSNGSDGSLPSSPRSSGAPSMAPSSTAPPSTPHPAPGPLSAHASPSDLADHFRGMSPFELDWRLRREPGATIACLVRSGLKSWHGRWFVVRAGSPPDVTNSIARLNEIAGGTFLDGTPQVRYAGEQLTAYDIFARDAVKWKLQALARQPNDDLRSLSDLGYEKAKAFARRWPWLPRYSAFCESTKARLPAPVNAKEITINAVPDDGWDMKIETSPVDQWVPGRARDEVREEADRFRSSPPPPLRALSPSTRLNFDPRQTSRALGPKWYVVFVGKTPGVFATDHEARKSYERVSCAVQCAYRTELDAQLAFQQAWMCGDVYVRNES